MLNSQPISVKTIDVVLNTCTHFYTLFLYFKKLYNQLFFQSFKALKANQLIIKIYATPRIKYVSLLIGASARQRNQIKNKPH